MSEHEKKFNKGEMQMRQPAGGCGWCGGISHLVVASRARPFPQGTRIEKELQCVSEDLRRQQVRFDRMQEDSIEDAKAVKSYLGEVHEMVTSIHKRHDSSPAKGSTLASAACKRDIKAEVHTADICRVGEMVLVREVSFFRVPIGKGLR